MSRTLVNGLGEAKPAKILKSNSKSEQKFLWKHNFKKIDNLRIKKEIEIYKANSLKSKAAKQNYLAWKKTELQIKKVFNDAMHNAEDALVKKGLLIVSDFEGEPVKKISNNNVKKIIEEYSSKKDEALANIKIKMEEIIKIKNSNAKGDINIAIKESKRLIKLFKELSKDFLNSFINSKNIDFKNVKDSRVEEKQILTQLNSKISNAKIKEENIQIENTNLTFLDKIKTGIDKNVEKAAKADVAMKFLKGKEKVSYEIEYKYKIAQINQKHHNIFIQKKKSWVNKLSSSLVLLEKAKSNKIKQKEKIKIIQNDFKNNRTKEWSDKKIEMKASSSSKRAKTVEKKKIYNKFQSEFRIEKLKRDEYFNCKNNVAIIRKDMHNDLKMQTKLHENELKDLLLQTPIETTKLKVWTSLILGSIFPGVGSLIMGKRIKGLIQIIATIFMAIIIAWILGAFPSSSGNGLMGLKTLGFDPKTSSFSGIGITNGSPNDGRFFLVTGSLAIIMAIVAIMYWIISILDNINQTNAVRLGMRPTGWKEQKKLLKTQGLPYLLSLPAMIFIIFIVVLPLLATILISFTNFGQKVWDPSTKSFATANGVTNKINWVGGDQFKLIFTVMGPEIKTVFIWTIIWTIGSTFTLLIIGTLFALIVNQNRIKFKNFFRIIYILPWAVPAFITILYFSIFFAHDGPFNKLFGLTTDWAQSGSKTKVLMIFMQGWLGHSYIFLLVTGMIQSIPKSLYEASRIDGASNFRQFRTITAPIIISKIAPLLVGQFVFNFNNFGLIYLFNGGGITEPGQTAGAQDIFISWIYKLVSGTNARPGAAAALSLFISVFTVTPSAFIFLRSKAFKRGV